jgi:hypothetical protein
MDRPVHVPGASATSARSRWRITTDTVIHISLSVAIAGWTAVSTVIALEWLTGGF